MSRLITEEMAQAAFDWLSSNSDDIAHARGDLIRAEYKVKRVFARLYLVNEGASEVRKSRVLCSEEYTAATDAHADAEARWEGLRDKRNKLELLIEAWRTQASNERGIMRAGR